MAVVPDRVSGGRSEAGGLGKGCLAEGRRRRGCPVEDMKNKYCAEMEKKLKKKGKSSTFFFCFFCKEYHSLEKRSFCIVVIFVMFLIFDNIFFLFPEKSFLYLPQSFCIPKISTTFAERCVSQKKHFVPHQKWHPPPIVAHHQPTSRRHCPNHVGRPESLPASAVHPGCRVVSSPVGKVGVRLLSLLDGLRPRHVDLDEMDPGVPTHGWQFFAAQASERHIRTEVGLDSHRRSRLSCVRNRARLLHLPSWLCRHRLSRASLRNFSACFFFAACGFPCPCLLVPAGVTVHSTSRCLGQSGLLRRKRCCKCLQRGRCHQPFRSGLGLASCTSRASLEAEAYSSLCYQRIRLAVHATGFAVLYLCLHLYFCLRFVRGILQLVTQCSTGRT